MLKDRRKYKRLYVKNRAIVLVSPTTILSYAVLDISESGLAFSYAGWEKRPTKKIRLEILDQNLFLNDIPINIIEDFQLDNGSKDFRRCSVKFASLEVDQKAILRQYIECQSILRY